MTQPLTENSPAVRLYAALTKCPPEQMTAVVQYKVNRATDGWLSRIAAEHERLVAERIRRA